MTIEIEEVYEFISSCTEKEAELVQDAAFHRRKYHMAFQNMKKRAELSRGDRVCWEHRERSGLSRKVFGKILHLNTSTAKVKAEDGQIWSVSLSLLEKEGA